MKIIEWSDDPKNPLNNECVPVTIWNAENHRLANEMCMYLAQNSGAVAVAANQVGSNQSFFVWKNEDDVLEVIINPVIVHGEDPQLMREGCLSFPGLEVTVERFNLVTVEYTPLLSTDGESTSLQLKGFAAQVFQHEIDHLLGLTFLDTLDDEEYGRALAEHQNLARNSRSRSNSV